MKYLKQFLPIIFVFLLSLVSVMPFFHSGFFPIHDNTQVQRVFEMTKSLRDGMFPVRWVADLGFGYGYPIFNFYAPFAYYVGSAINIFGFDLLFSTKLMMALGVILSGFSMYLLAKEIWGKAGGIIAALLYLYVPYHAVDIFVRGDVAEFWAYAFIPFVFYSLLNVHKTGKFRFIIFGALSYAALISSHNLTALMATPFILVFALMLFLRNKQSGKNLSFTLGLGILLSVFYWLPALLEINYTNVLSQVGGGADYKDHFVCLSQLWSSPWGFGGSVRGCVDGLSFMIGKLHIVLSLVAVLLSLLALGLKKLDVKKGWLLLFFVISLLFSIFLTLDYSKFIWDLVRPMALFQYPWRFLIMITFFISLISGSLPYLLASAFKNKWVNLIILLTLSLVIVGFNSKYFFVQKYLSVTSSSFTNDYFLKFTTSQISSEYMPKDFSKPILKEQIADISKIASKNVSLISHSQKNQQIRLSLFANSDTSIVLPIAYFPAWNAFVDGKNTKISENKKGSLINIGKGNHLIEFKFIQTPVEKVSDLVSLASIFGLIAGIIYSVRRYDQS